MATSYHNGNECALHSIRNTAWTSTVTKAKKKKKKTQLSIKRLTSWQSGMTGEGMFTLTCLSASSLRCCVFISLHSVAVQLCHSGLFVTTVTQYHYTVSARWAEWPIKVIFRHCVFSVIRPLWLCLCWQHKQSASRTLQYNPELFELGSHSNGVSSCFLKILLCVCVWANNSNHHQMLHVVPLNILNTIIIHYDIYL